MIVDELYPKALILPKDTDAGIAGIKANAEMGTLVFSTDGVKINFIKNAGGSEAFS